MVRVWYSAGKVSVFGSFGYGVLGVGLLCLGRWGSGPGDVLCAGFAGSALVQVPFLALYHCSAWVKGPYPVSRGWVVR